MGAESEQIAHDQLGLFEHVCVQTLHHKGTTIRIGGQGHQERVIHVSRSKRVNRVDLLGRVKQSCNRVQRWIKPGSGIGHDESHETQIETMPCICGSASAECAEKEPGSGSMGSEHPLSNGATLSTHC